MFELRSPRRELDELRGELYRLREFVEARAQAQENLLRALLAETEARLTAAASAVCEREAQAPASEAGAREALEARIQVATREAIAFAEHGLMRQQAALRGLGRRVAELARLPAPAPAWVAATPPAAAGYAIGAEAEGCRRLDIRDESEALFLADLADLPIPPGGATRLVLTHIVEGAPVEALTQRLLPHWRERLAPAGELVLITLDGPAWGEALARDAADFERLRARLAGQGRRPVRSLFDRESLAALLAAAGFAVASPESSAEKGALKVVARAAP